MAHDTSDTDVTWAAVEVALVAHLEATGWLNGETYLDDVWVIAALPYLERRGETRYFHGGRDGTAHHRALGLVGVSKDMLSQPSCEHDDD